MAVVVMAGACSGSNRDTARDAGAGRLAEKVADAAADIRVLADAAREAGGPTDAGTSLRDAASDAGAPAQPRDAGTAADGGPPTGTVSLPSQQIGPLAGTPDAIAADQAGVYWLTHANELWMLDGNGGNVPRRLAAEVAESLMCSGHGRLAVADDQLFWAAEWWSPGERYVLDAALHRTTKAGDDVTLVSQLDFADPINVVISGDDVYWNEGVGAGPDVPSTFVRTLPRNAAPGDTPQSVVSVNGFYEIGGVAVIGSDLYWTTTYLGTTVFRPALHRADLQALREGSNPTPTLVAGAWFVRGYEGNLFLAQATDLWHTAVTRVPESLGAGTELAVVENSAIAQMQFLDGWALTSVGAGGCGEVRYTLLAIPVDGPDGHAVQLATDLLTPGVLGRELTFVDGQGMLHLVSLDDLRAALADNR